MDKPAIKKFASWARNELLSRVSQKALQFGIEPDRITTPTRILSSVEERQLKILIGQIEEKTYSQVIEEIAYTWFNRFCALRFMEVNGYLPSQTRVFTDGQGRFRPLILSDVIELELEGLNREKVYTFKQENKDEELYKYLILTLCGALEPTLPGMFHKIDDSAILLFPDNLLHEESIAGQFAAAIPESDWLDGVQIIGWLYQYYNSEPKNKVFADLKKNIKISKENIPAATQLFTPDWIVRYMVENSLGRLWLEGHPSENLKKNWRYFLDEAPQEPEVQIQLEPIRKEYAALRPEQIRCIDPCSGSGHILAYMFDVLVQIYETYGYTTRDAVASIVTNNLFGLDIDERAAQLSYFTVMMKARQYERGFFRRGIQPNVYAIAESNNLPEHTIEYFAWKDSALLVALQTIMSELHDAKEYGSILTISPQDWPAIHARMEQILADPNYPERENIQKYLFPLIHTAEILSQTYDIVCTNPPYMGGSGMDAKLSEFVKKNYPDSKSDMSTVCMERTLNFCKPNGYMTMINIPVWMFLSSYEKLRAKIITNNTIVSMVHPGRGIFGSDFGTTSFVIAKEHISGYKGHYRRLFEKQGEVETNEVREKQFFDGQGKSVVNQDDFLKIPSSPIAYWVPKNLINSFKNGISIEDISDFTGSQHKTANNDKYLRYWWEIKKDEIESRNWIFYIKGGEYRKWYGNIDLVVDWRKDAILFYKTNLTSNMLKEKYWYREGITYTSLTSSTNGFRYLPPIGVFDIKGPSIINVENLYYCLGYFNTCISNLILKLLNPTITLQVKDVKNNPIIISENSISLVESLVQENIALSRTDWDAFETSWDFQRHPLVPSHPETASQADTLRRRVSTEEDGKVHETSSDFKTLPLVPNHPGSDVDNTQKD